MAFTTITTPTAEGGKIETQQEKAQSERFGPFEGKLVNGGGEGYDVMSETITYSNKSTSHPVQSGANITDHVINEQTKLSFDLVWSLQTPDDKRKRLSEIEQLLQKKEFIEILTPDKLWKNVTIEGITKTESSDTISDFAIRVDVLQHIIVNVETTTVAKRAPRAKQSSPKKTAGKARKLKKKTVAPTPIAQKNVSTMQLVWKGGGKIIDGITGRLK